jgi:hypothetical protein
MERSDHETTNTFAWAGEDWKIEPFNGAGLGTFRIVPLAVAGLLVATAPPAPAFEYSSADSSVGEGSVDSLSDEDLEDLADGLETLRRYQSEGVDGFVPYRDYQERRRA